MLLRSNNFSPKSHMGCYVNVRKFNRQRSKGAGENKIPFPELCSSSAGDPQFKVITPRWLMYRKVLAYPFSCTFHTEGAGYVAMANAVLFGSWS